MKPPVEGARLRAEVQVQTEPPFDEHEAVRFLSKADPVLREHIARVGPLRIDRRPLDDTYEALARAIVYQQLNGKAAATIAGRVMAVFGRETYPPPAMLLAASDEVLRAAGLSRNKLAALRDLAQKVIDGVVPPVATLQLLPDEEIIERLTVVRGIGRWTVEMLLLFRLGRPDVLPVDDFGVRKGFGLLYRDGEMPTPRELAKYAERWRPFRSAASWYMWRATDR
jgi:DNA-3-methyladenine glycosylase II